MSGLVLLDVAIAMIFLYLLMSLICSAASELISAVFHLRAKNLEQGILRLLENRELANALYDHPMVRNLHGEEKLWLPRFRKDLPSYVPARNFALALMDLALPGAGTQGALLPPLDERTEQTVRPPNAAELLRTLQDEASHLPPKLRHALVCLVQAAGADAVRARMNIEDWYNSTMDRVSGAYKRRTQFIIFAIGLITTVFVNADSLAVAKRLSTNKVLAAAVAESASTYVKENPALKHPQNASEAQHAFSETLATFDRLGVPTGWGGPEHENSWPPWSGVNESPTQEWSELIAIHWSGWLLTAFAISFGAPFWFDVLNRFMVVRSTVKPQEKSLEEGPKN